MVNKKKSVKGFSTLLPADNWKALFFETDKEGLVEEGTVTTVRVVCWASDGGRIVGLIPNWDGLVVAEDEELFRGYVDGSAKKSEEDAILLWNEGVDIVENEGDEDDEDDDADGG